MCIVGVLRDMAGQAAAAAAAGDVDGMRGLRLSEVATRTLFAQHRVGDGVPERLQVLRMFGTGMAVDDRARRVHHAARRVHEAGGDGRDAIGVAVTADLLRVVEIPRECDQARVRRRFIRLRVVAGMTKRAAARRKRVAGTEAGPVLVMTARTADRSRLRRRRQGSTQEYDPARSDEGQ